MCCWASASQLIVILDSMCYSRCGISVLCSVLSACCGYQYLAYVLIACPQSCVVEPRSQPKHAADKELEHVLE